MSHRISPRRRILKFLVMVVVGGGLALGGLWQWWHLQTRPPGGEVVRVEIPAGTSSRQIGQWLEEARIIRSAEAWHWWVRTVGRRWVFQAGVYELDPNLPMPLIAAQLREGRVLQMAVTILEGWRMQQMATALAEQGWFSADVFMEAATAVLQQQPQGLPTHLESLEGYLFPETYHLPLLPYGIDAATSQAQLLVEQMIQQFVQVALPLYTEADLSRLAVSLSLHEWVTLASIVEKEAVVPEERRLIAGVFMNRLQQGIPLGADPTVEYAFNIRQTPERRLTWAEVQRPSPYNTYLNAGLPPGPIASPGLASLEATLDPEKTDYLYFVARYDGTHVFSKTLADHEAAQRQIIQQQQLP